MNRIVLPIIVVVVLVVGYGAGQLTAPKASPPISVSSPTVPSRQIEPNMPTGGDSAVSTPPLPSAVAGSTPQYWYGPDRNEVRAGLAASIKKFKEENQGNTQAPPKLQPLNVQ